MNIFLPVKTGPIFDERVRQPERWNATNGSLRVAVVDWPSLGQWACSLAHWSGQRRYTCRQKSWFGCTWQARGLAYFIS